MLHVVRTSAHGSLQPDARCPACPAATGHGLSGAQFAPLVTAFEKNFAAIIETGRATDLLGQVRGKIANDAVIPTSSGR